MILIRLEKYDNESLLEHHKRLVYGKLVDKTLSDLDYSELAEYVYGQAYSSDVARRMMYGSKRTLDMLAEERTSSVNSDDVITEIEAKTLELQKERQKFFDQRREFNRLITHESRMDNLIDSLKSAAESLSDTVGQMYNSGDCYVYDYCGNEAVLVFSDWHFGMKANNAFNYFDTKVCRERVIKVVDDARMRIVGNNCRKLHIVILGDMVHGAIHVSARVASEELVCDQLMMVSEMLAQSILELSKCVQEVTVYTTYGNHARTIQNKGDSVHRDNMERLIPWWLRQRIKAASVIDEKYNNINVIDSDNEFVLMDVCGHAFCASHGDLDNLHNSPTLLTTLFQKKYGKDVEYILLGDKHHRESFEELGVTAMICGSLCGADDYANSKRLFSTPSQLLLIVNDECGVDAEYRLRCDQHNPRAVCDG